MALPVAERLVSLDIHPALKCEDTPKALLKFVGRPSD